MLEFGLFLLIVSLLLNVVCLMTQEGFLCFISCILNIFSIIILFASIHGINEFKTAYCLTKYENNSYMFNQAKINSISDGSFLYFERKQKNLK